MLTHVTSRIRLSLRRYVETPGPGPVKQLLRARRWIHDSLSILEEDFREYGDFFSYRIGSQLFFATRCPHHVRYVLEGNSSNFQRSFIYAHFEPLLGKGLLTSDGPFWLRQRRLMQPGFQREALTGVGPLMLKEIERHTSGWSEIPPEGTILDIANEMMDLSILIAARTMLDSDLEEVTDVIREGMKTSTETFIVRVNSPITLPLWVPLPIHRRFWKARRDLEQVVDGIIASRRTRRRKPSRPDLLSVLMAVRHEDSGEPMDDRQIRNEVMTLLLAGFETTASNLAWTWYLLARHPEVEGRLHEEIDRVLGSRPPTVADLKDLPYSRQILNESLRLYPPAWIFSRTAQADDEIDGHHIPAGSTIQMVIYSIHHHEDLWPNPDRFDPDRFATWRRRTEPRYAYLPFGGGGHKCIGEHFAFMEAHLALVSIAQRYVLRVLEGHPVVLDPKLTLRQRHGLKMRVKPRVHSR